MKRAVGEEVGALCEHLEGVDMANVKARGDHRERSETAAFIELGPRQPGGGGDKTVVELNARDLLPIVRDVCRVHGVTLEEVCGTLCSHSVARARHEAWWRVWKHPERHYSVDDVGRIFGRPRAAIDYGVRAHARRLATHADRKIAKPEVPIDASGTRGVGMVGQASAFRSHEA